MRHAKAARDEAQWQDFDRPLNERGRADATRMGKWLAQQKLTPDWICASASVRTRETAERVAFALNFQRSIALSRDLYHATAERYLVEIRQMPHDVSCLLVIGHNPGLEQLTQQLSGEFVSLPTAAIAHFSALLASWEDLAATLPLKNLATP